MATIRIFQWFGSLCLLGILPPLVAGCSLVGNAPERLSLAAMFSRAPYVVHATGVGKNERENLAIMEVHCVFKPNMTLATVPFPETIYVHNFVSHLSCLENPDYEVGVGYAMALIKYSGPSIPGFEQGAIFDNYEPNILQMNIYKANTGLLQYTLNVCGVAPSAVGNSTCPVSPAGVTQDECDGTTSMIPSLTAVSATITVALIMVDF